MAVLGIGGRIDRPAAIRARSQEFDLRLYRTVRPFYLQNVVSGNFHIRTSFGLHRLGISAGECFTEERATPRRFSFPTRTKWRMGRGSNQEKLSHLDSSDFLLSGTGDFAGSESVEA
jgi:hypothetical protein